MAHALGITVVTLGVENKTDLLLVAQIKRAIRSHGLPFGNGVGLQEQAG